MTNIEKDINEFVRDVTEVTPRPKSEVRRRLNDIIKQSTTELLEDMPLPELSEIHKSDEKLYGLAHFKTGKNEVIKEIKQWRDKVINNK